ncbi:MAG: hypothetical protein HKN88_03245 [Gammaproteobacteria bacterium]|nr:hypothetical protein [Gammaproteobacteria bacterium]NNC97068.1 hypothetical protein [Gammaproteobacteria bacterium]NNM14336.1 hypothetical protein [Gammaproteobacteria bacterium]
MNNKYKDYVFTKQRREYRLRIYQFGASVKLFIDDRLCDISVPNGMSNPIIDYYFKDERKQKHRIKVERKQHWFKHYYSVLYDDHVMYKTQDNDPVNNH